MIFKPALEPPKNSVMNFVDLPSIPLSPLLFRFWWVVVIRSRSDRHVGRSLGLGADRVRPSSLHPATPRSRRKGSPSSMSLAYLHYSHLLSCSVSFFSFHAAAEIRVRTTSTPSTPLHSTPSGPFKLSSSSSNTSAGPMQRRRTGSRWIL